MNSKLLSKLLLVLSLVISLVGIGFYIWVLVTGDDAFKPEESGDPEEAARLQNLIISPFVWYTLIILGGTLVVAVASSVISLVKKPEALKKTLISIASLGVVLVIAYLLKDGTEVIGADGLVLEGGAENATANVWSSTGIWYSVILGGVGLALFLVDMVKGLVKS
jgi:hypothetical protein